jgi:hypothetical protein
MTRTYNWPSREEWAKQRRTYYWDDDLRVSRKLQDYATPEEIDAITTALRALWLAEGRKMQAAKQAAGSRLQQPGEDNRSYFMRVRAMTETEREPLHQWRTHQDERRQINQALKTISEGKLPDERLREDGKLILASIKARYDAAWEAAHAERKREIENRPIDDAAWEDHLRWRAWIEGGPRITTVTVAAPRLGEQC